MCRSSRIFVYIFILSLMLPSFLLRAQSLTQTVRDKITEQDSRFLLPGVNVIVVGADVFLGGSTNEQGEFHIGDVLLRRTTLKISYVGYEEKALSNLLITSGRERVPEMGLQEFLISMVCVVITAHQNKSQIANKMALTGDASADSDKVFSYLC